MLCATLCIKLKLGKEDENIAVYLKWLCIKIKVH